MAFFFYTLFDIYDIIICMTARFSHLTLIWLYFMVFGAITTPNVVSARSKLGNAMIDTIFDNGFDVEHLKDRCTESGKYVNEYTIDRRCYVTDEQKKQYPFNTIVRITHKKNNDHWCTGVIVKNPKDNKELYIITASHCVPNALEDNMIYLPNGAVRFKEPDKIFVTLQNGQQLDNHIIYSGNISNNDDTNNNNIQNKRDFAILRVDEKDTTNIPFANISTMNREDNVNVIGYGGAVILSNKQIGALKKTFISFLKKNSDALSIRKYAEQFYNVMPTIPDILKASLECKIPNQDKSFNYKNGCQGWGGNSGGPIFDDQGNVVAITSWAQDYIYVISNERFGAFSVDVEGTPSIKDILESKNK